MEWFLNFRLVILFIFRGVNIVETSTNGVYRYVTKIHRDRLCFYRIFCPSTARYSFPRALRNSIYGFSLASRKRMAEYLRNCEAVYRFMGTFTLREYSNDGMKFKSNLDRFLVFFLESLRREAIRQGKDASKESVFWFLEFQERGAPHVHLYYTSFVDWKLAAEYWCYYMNDDKYDIMKTCSKLEAFQGKNGAFIAYVNKYATKKDQKEPPEDFINVGRFWGVRGLKKVVSADIESSRSQQVGLIEMALNYTGKKPRVFDFKTYLSKGIVCIWREGIPKELVADINLNVMRSILDGKADKISLNEVLA